MFGRGYDYNWILNCRFGDMMSFVIVVVLRDLVSGCVLMMLID